MSDAAYDELPPFAQPYLADFQQLARMLERIPGFLLQPVEAPAPDLARVFAEWLGRHGWNVRIHELRDAGALRDLAVALVHRIETTGRDIVLVVQNGGLDDAATRASFAALNMARDPIAHALPMPLLWWGSSAFMRTTWSHAPDWWSVAATPFRIPFRSLQDLPSDLPHGAHWWTGAVNRDLRGLEEGLATSRAQGEPAQTARSGLQLAEAQLSRRDRLGAQATLAAIRPSIFEHAKAFRSRWILLDSAADAAAAAETGVSIEALRAEAAAAETSGEQLREVGLRLQLAERLESGATPLPADALREYLRARQLTATLGDLAATLSIDVHIILDLALVANEPLRAELDQFAADAASRMEDPVARAHASLIRAKIALMSQAFANCEAFAQAALKQARLADEPELETAAHGILACAGYLRGDFNACLDHANASLAGALAADDLSSQILAGDLRVRAQSALGKPREAAYELVELWDLLAPFEHHEWVWCGLLSRMAALALQAGDPAVAANFALLSVACDLRQGRLPDRAGLFIDLDALAAHEPTAARLLSAIFEFTDLDAAQGLDADARTRLDSIVEAIDDESTRLEEALDAVGVEAFDPNTWGTTPAAPPPAAT